MLLVCTWRKGKKNPCPAAFAGDTGQGFSLRVVSRKLRPGYHAKRNPRERITKIIRFYSTVSKLFSKIGFYLARARTLRAARSVNRKSKENPRILSNPGKSASSNPLELAHHTHFPGTSNKLFSSRPFNHRCDFFTSGRSLRIGSVPDSRFYGLLRVFDGNFVHDALTVSEYGFFVASVRNGVSGE